MKRLAIISIYAVMSIFLSAVCTDYDKYDNGSQPQTNVYIAGDIDNGDNFTAVLWKNGKPTTFPDYSSVIDIAVSENDVYLLGGTNSVYCYWKMEQPQTPTLLEGGNGHAIAVSSNGDVYVGGEQRAGDNDPLLPCYWKNGQKVSLSVDYPYELRGGEVEDIAISGDNVYIVGGLFGSSNELHSSAVYWKNGQQITLAHNQGYPSSIAVSGNDVYVCNGGSDGSGIIEEDGNAFAVYWENGRQITLTQHRDGYDDYIPSGIAVYGSDVYVCGYFFRPMIYNYSGSGSGSTTGETVRWKAVYWKNGQLITLAQNAVATGIAVHGNDVYVCGYMYSGSGTLAVYWKNGKQVVLGQGVANAIVIK